MKFQWKGRQRGGEGSKGRTGKGRDDRTAGRGVEGNKEICQH